MPWRRLLLLLSPPSSQEDDDDTKGRKTDVDKYYCWTVYEGYTTTEQYTRDILTDLELLFNFRRYNESWWSFSRRNKWIRRMTGNEEMDYRRGRRINTMTAEHQWHHSWTWVHQVYNTVVLLFISWNALYFDNDEWLTEEYNPTTVRQDGFPSLLRTFTRQWHHGLSGVTPNKSKNCRREMKREIERKKKNTHFL